MIFYSKKIFKKIKRYLMFKESHTVKLNENFKKSYSQCGEDLIVKYVFNLRGIATPTFIDIGANHPYLLSNTALLFETGSRGINIEANPFLIEKFKHFRKEDININVGIGSKNEELDFYMMSEHTLSTFSKEECEKFISTGKYFLKEKRKIKLITVNEVLSKYCNGIFPDFLSLDVEGLDFEIIKSIDFSKYKPKVICIEAAEYSPIGAGKRKTELINHIIDNGYYEYANTNLNSILVLNEFWFI